jgi:hypothetical protein
MNKAMLALAATVAGLLSVSASAGAAPFQPLGQRLAALEQRINQGLHNGAITRSDGDSLRVGVARIRLIEAQYRRGGIDFAEQQDLDRRFDNLARHVRTGPSSGNYRSGGYRDSRSGGYRDSRSGGSYASRDRYPSRGSYRPNDRGNYRGDRGSYDRGYR